MRTTTTARPATPAPHTRAEATRGRRLGRYSASATQQREVLRVPLPDGSALVIDYELATLAAGRLVAHLAADEPAENAQIVCDLYIADASRGRCRAVTNHDFQATPHAAPPAPHTETHAPPGGPLQDDDGYLYRLRAIPADRGAPELRWTRSHQPGREQRYAPVSLRDLIGSLQAYEPAREITRAAIARHAEHISTRRLQIELDRLANSPVVLNRKLRQQVQRMVERGEVSISQIAVRCGRIKRDSHGKLSGETSWVARRIGLMPEAGAQKPCPWIRSDVLARIARDGLGISPHEAEA